MRDGAEVLESREWWGAGVGTAALSPGVLQSHESVRGGPRARGLLDFSRITQRVASLRWRRPVSSSV